MNIETQVKVIIAEYLGHAADTLSDDAELEADLGGDSLDTIEIVMACEDRFQITIEESDSERVKTVRDLVALVSRMKGPVA